MHGWLSALEVAEHIVTSLHDAPVEGRTQVLLHGHANLDSAIAETREVDQQDRRPILDGLSVLVLVIDCATVHPAFWVSH